MRSVNSPNSKKASLKSWNKLEKYLKSPINFPQDQLLPQVAEISLKILLHKPRQSTKFDFTT
jgi:hypothetical protein